MSIQSLSESIERLVHGHLDEVRRAAESAVARAVGASTRSGSGKKSRATVATSSRSAASAKRRTPVELSELAERLYASVRDKPGESMRVLSEELGASPRELHRPMESLKQGGRVRSVGERQRTRYFPMASGESNAA
jgi:hypothetical protein|tara:strand:- start:1429 stop:1836 length:408 start_codon:yes stop_codon:yes gene_type:complete